MPPERPKRRRRKAIGKAAEQPRPGLDQDHIRADAGSMWRKSRAQRVTCELGDGAGHLHAGRTAADEHEGEQLPARGGIVGLLRLLEGKEQAAADLDGVGERLEARGVFAQSAWPK